MLRGAITSSIRYGSGLHSSEGQDWGNADAIKKRFWILPILTEYLFNEIIEY